MKILAIRLKNLASIEGSFEIDFTAEPLQSAGIFAISGPTGAGKSTILDALCLALYDKTPRFAATGENLQLKDVGDSTINQSDVKNILRRGAGEGFAEVDFMGVDGHRYRSRWSVRRARSKADGSLQPQLFQVTDLDTEEELQGTKTELLNRLSNLVGLTYDQFTRTVLLAQNDFATFLKSKESAKAELLEKLTGTDIYSRLSKEVYVRTKQASEAYRQLKSNIEMIKLLPEEEIGQLHKNREELEKHRKAAGVLVEELSKRLKQLQELQVQEELLRKKQVMEFAEKQLQESLQASLRSSTEALRGFKEKCIAIEADFKKARELDVRIQVAQANFSQVEQDGRTVDRKRTDKAFNTEVMKELQQANDERSRQLNNFGIQALGEEQAALINEQKRLQEARQQVADWLKLRKNADQLATDLREKQALAAKQAKEQAVVGEQLLVKQAETRTLQGVYEGLRAAMGKDVQALRQSLHAEEPCPVCGSTAHPYVQAAEAVESHYSRIEKEYKEAADALQVLNNRSISLQQELKYLQENMLLQQKQINAVQEEIIQKTPQREEEQELSFWDTQLEALRVRQDALSKRLSEYQQLYEEWLWHDYKIKEHLLGTLRNERQALLKGKSVDDAEAAMKKGEEQLTRQVETARKETETAATRISGIQGEIRQLSLTVETLQKERQGKESEEMLQTTIPTWQKKKEELEKQLSAIAAQLLQQEENHVRLKSIKQELKEKEAFYEKWEKLNKLIGSADGNKFKVIAQSYTLNLLLMHANKHLEYLSKRYKLQQVPDTLALQVIDCDMCDEVRTVYSLSGGESFLISLALALGLSSLSGNNLKVESLFIDEGFGSLDTESLRVAMEALEQLQLQGRKIGVISHVQEMSERIPVQIQVQKTINGRSRIEIVS